MAYANSRLDDKNLWTKSLGFRFARYIVFVWSQYDGANIEQWTIGYGWRQNQKLSSFGETDHLTMWEEQYLDPTSTYITSVIVSKPLVLYWRVKNKLPWSLVLIYNSYSEAHKNSPKFNCSVFSVVLSLFQFNLGDQILRVQVRHHLGLTASMPTRRLRWHHVCH